MPDKLETVKAAADAIREDLTRALTQRVGKTMGPDEVEEARTVLEGILNGHMEMLLPGHREIKAYTRIEDGALETILVFSGSLKFKVTPEDAEEPKTDGE